MYNITVIATDLGVPSFSSATLIFVHTAAETNCTPTFTKYPRNEIKIGSNSLGEVVAEVHAVACGAEVLYSLEYSTSYRNSGIFESFWIDPVDGIIFLLDTANLHIGQRIDLLVTAKAASKNTTVAFGVTVVDKKDRNPGITTDSLHILVGLSLNVYSLRA